MSQRSAGVLAPGPADCGGLLSVMRPVSGDAVILTFYRSCVAEARRLHRALDTVHGCRVTLVPVLANPDPSLRQRLHEALAAHSDQRVVILTLEPEPLPDEELISLLGRAEIIRIIGRHRGLLNNLGLPSIIPEACRALAAVLHTARAATLRTRGEGALFLAFDPGTRWTVNDGVPRPGEITVLPAGEVSAVPSLVSGSFVADGGIRVNRPVRWAPSLASTPVTLRVDAGAVQDVDCADPWAARLLRRALQLDGMRRIGRVAIDVDGRSPGFAAPDVPPEPGHPTVRLVLGATGGGRPKGRTGAGLRLELTSAKPELAVDGDPVDLSTVVRDSAAQHTTGR